MEMSYLSDKDVYIIDFSGMINLKDGLSNINFIENEIKKFSNGKDTVKLLIDFRNTVWESRETHDILSEKSRKMFNPKNFRFTIISAILNNEFDSPSFKNEHWFTKMEDAIIWLKEKK